MAPTRRDLRRAVRRSTTGPVENWRPAPPGQNRTREWPANTTPYRRSPAVSAAEVPELSINEAVRVPVGPEGKYGWVPRPVGRPSGLCHQTPLIAAVEDRTLRPLSVWSGCQATVRCPATNGLNVRALLNFARLSDADAAWLSAQLQGLGIQIVATTSYRKEDPRRFGPDVRPYWWRDYRPEAVATTWEDVRPESILSAQEILALLPAAERPSPHVGGSIEAYWRLRADVVRAHRALDEVRPDVVLSVDQPENAFDFLVMRLAQERGTPVVVGRGGITPISRVVMTDPFGPSLLPDGTCSPAIIPCVDGSEGESTARRAALNIIEARVRGVDDWRWGGGGLPDVAMESAPSRFARRIARRSRRLRFRRIERPNVTGRRYLQQLASDLSKAASGEFPAEGRNDCVLLLHYQPEASTITHGGWSVNQLEAVKVVADGLPEGWRLFVREHPMMLSASRSRASASFRPPGFYERVAKMPRTQLLPMVADAPLDLRMARMVVTSTGTVGLEALALGIPVLHLGRAPYRNFPGARWIESPSVAEVRAATDQLVGMPRSEIVSGFLRSSELLESVSYHMYGAGPDLDILEPFARGVREWAKQSQG